MMVKDQSVRCPCPLLHALAADPVLLQRRAGLINERRLAIRLERFVVPYSPEYANAGAAAAEGCEARELDARVL